jgi:hypothetical protein
MSVLNKLFNYGGLDLHIISILILRLWSILAGGCTVLLIPFFFSPLQQGYYYTFNAVLSSQMFFELGVNSVLVQLTSHAAAHLYRVKMNRFEGDVHWRYALSSLEKMSAKWNGVTAFLFFIIVCFCGFFFFSRKGSLPLAEWVTIWIALIAATAVNLFLGARLSICEGLGEIGAVARLRFWQSVVGYSGMWLLLINDGGLWSVTALPITSAIGTICWLSRRQLRESLAVLRPHSVTENGYTYYRDVFPLQWRIALSWVSGYFVFHFITPVVFAHRGEEAAGQIGLALTIFSAFSSLGYSWIAAKVAALNGHVARGERRELNKLFDKLLIRSSSVTMLISGGFVLVVNQLGFLAPEIVVRLPPTPSLLLLTLSTVGNNVIFALAAYMRAHKEEPLTTMSIVTALLTGTGVWLTSYISITATVGVFAVVSIFVGLPWCLIIFFSYRKIN